MMSHLIPKRVKHWVSKYFQTNFNIEMVFEQTLEIKGKMSLWGYSMRRQKGIVPITLRPKNNGNSDDDC